MKENVASTIEEPATGKRSRNRFLLGLLGFISGLLVSFTGKFLANYEGPLGIRISVMLAPWVLIGLLAVFSRRLYQADELEVLINRQALAFAFYAALIGLMVQYQLQIAGIIPDMDWTAKQLITGLVLLMVAGIGWSKRRYR